MFVNSQDLGPNPAIGCFVGKRHCDLNIACGVADVIVYRSSPHSQREALLDVMWNVWPDLPNYGCKAAQFVDLLGYFTIKTPQPSDKKVREFKGFLIFDFYHQIEDNFCCC